MKCPEFCKFFKLFTFLKEMHAHGLKTKWDLKVYNKK